ncbi:MAG TPA: hypothetical protein VFQ80_13350, partial [Thermomicrobiales bacterium]|nr:hypothetical protein [Thermomicrobiales bacterium]
MTVERQTPERATAAAADAGLVRMARSDWRARLRGRQALVVGCALIAALLLVSLLAPILAPYDPTEIHPIDGLKPPSAEFL